MLAIEVLRGQEAVRAAMTPERVGQWQGLAEEAKHVTVFQTPGFVLSWYQAYEATHEPLLVLGSDSDGRLAGVLPLAIPRREPGSLVFAGAHQCEYAGWIAPASLHEEFPALAVARLRELGLFTRPWRWKWLAPGAGLGWFEHPAFRASGIAWRTREAANAIMSLQEQDQARFFDPRKKNFKRKLGRLKQLGEVRLVALEPAGLQDELFTRFTTLYDIRQLARYGVAPFTDDPLKATFHRRLFEQLPNQVLLFALMAGSTRVAFHMALGDKRRAIYCMSPFDHRWVSASPGKLTADLVAETLWERGFEIADHTPGGDAYKEEAASTHETVHDLQLFPSRAHARRQDAREQILRGAKQVALRIGLSAERIQRLRRLANVIRARPPWSLAASVLRALRRWAWSQDSMIVYRFGREDWEKAYPGATPDPLFHRDALEDFLHYAGSIPWRSRQQMMVSAIQSLERGHHCYTVVENDMLVHWAWIQLDVDHIHPTEVDYTYRLAPGAAVAYDVYTEPRARGRGLHTRSFRHRLHEVFAMGARYNVSVVREGNRVSQHNTEKVGARRVARIRRMRRLGRTRWSEEAL